MGRLRLARLARLFRPMPSVPDAMPVMSKEQQGSALAALRFVRMSRAVEPDARVRLIGDDDLSSRALARRARGTLKRQGKSYLRVSEDVAPHPEVEFMK